MLLADEAVASKAVVANALVVVLRENFLFLNAFCFFIAIVIFTRIQFFAGKTITEEARLAGTAVVDVVAEDGRAADRVL